MHSMTTVVLCFVAIIHFTIASGNQTNPMEDDLAILNKYLEMDHQMKKFVHSGIDQFLPYFMEANQHLNLSPRCTKNLFAVISGLRKLKLWALSFVDATGKPSDGIFWINLQLLGNFDQCLNITVLKEDGEVDFRGKHCTVEGKPLRSMSKNPKAQKLDIVEATRNTSDIIRWLTVNERMGHAYTSRFGMCVPSGCSQEDVQQVVEYYSKVIHWNTTVAFCQVEDSFPAVTKRTISIMFVFSFLIAVGIVASGLQYYLKVRGSTKNNRWMEFLLCFSITSNFQKVMDTTSSDDRLSCLHGIRTLSIFYVILSHRYILLGDISFMRQTVLIEGWNKTFFSQIITNAQIIVDTFIFMGGLLNSYLRRTKESKIRESGPIKFFMMVFFRVWRFYPAYICAILLNYLFVARGPIAPLMEKKLWIPCDKYWWRNLLFIHNFFAPGDMCLLHSWYLSVEMQLFTFTFIPVTLLLRNRRKGYIVSGIFIVCGIVISIIQTWISKVPANHGRTAYEGSTDLFDKSAFATYFLPFMHIAPYFIGILLGDFIATKEKIKIPVVYQVVGWILASLIYIAILFSTITLGPGSTHTQLEDSFYLGFRSLSVLGVAWMVLCCAFGYGGIINYILSLKIWVPISRTSYFMYLIHLILQYFYVYNQGTPSNLQHMVLIWQYMGDVVITGLLSLSLTVLVESPNIALMKMAFERISKGGKKSPENSGGEIVNGSVKANNSNSYELKNNSEKEISKL